MLYAVHLQHFIAIVIDHLDGDLSTRWPRKGAADRAVEGCPGGFINLGAEGAFELLIGFIGAGEVGVADKEAFAVILGVNEPTGDLVGGTAADLVGGGVIDIDALVSTVTWPALSRRMFTSGSPKTMKPQTISMSKPTPCIASLAASLIC